MVVISALWLALVTAAAGTFPVNWRELQIPPSASWRAPNKLPAAPVHLTKTDSPTEEGFRELVRACDRDDVASCTRAAERLQAPHVKSDPRVVEKLLKHACDLHFATCAAYAGFLFERDGLGNADATKIITYRCSAYGLCGELGWLTILKAEVNSRKEAVKIFYRHPPNENPDEADLTYAKAVTDCDAGALSACATEHAVALEAADPASPAYKATPTFIPGAATKIRAAFGKQERKALDALCFEKAVAEACTTEKAMRAYEKLER